MVSPGQIYFLDKVRVGKSDYGRPCLVLRASAVDTTVCYFSTKFELMPLNGISIFETDPEFPASGLERASFIISNRTPDIRIESFEGARLLGHATGNFKKKVERWWGAPLN